MSGDGRVSLHPEIGNIFPPLSEKSSTAIDVTRFARGLHMLRLGGERVNESRLVHLR
jgi:hypothetical protein